jgi:hypothetical protein
MQRSTIHIAQSLSDQLLLLPAIVNKFQAKSLSALSELISWIDDCESLMLNFRMPQAAQLAGYKAKIIAPIFDDKFKSKLRRQQQGIAVGLILELQQTVGEALAPHSENILQGRALARQLLQVLAQSGSIHYDASSDISDVVDQIWALCRSHEQLKPIAAQLRAVLPATDIKLILVQEFEPADFVKNH